MKRSTPAAQPSLLADGPKRIDHTPAPWRDAGAVGYSTGIISDKGWIALAYGPSCNPQSAGNVSVMVAAPEMYAALLAYEALDEQRMACEDCEDRLERAPEACGRCFPFADDARLKMRAALAKVRGEA